MIDLTIHLQNHNAEPPELPTGNDYYLGYLMNQHGEQLIFHGALVTGKCALYHSDTDWERNEVRDGTVPLILNEQEHSWLDTCWRIFNAWSIYRREGRIVDI